MTRRLVTIAVACGAPSATGRRSAGATAPWPTATAAQAPYKKVARRVAGA